MRTARLLLLGGALLLGACRDDGSSPLAPAAPPDARTSTTAAVGDGSVRLILTVVARDRSIEDMIKDLESLGGSVVRRYRNFPLLAVIIPDTDEARKAVGEIEGVARVSPDELYETTLDASVPLIGGDVVHQLGRRGDGVAVAVLDNGFDRDHPFLAGRVVAEACFSSASTSSETSLCANGDVSQEGIGSASLNVAACRNGTVNLCDHGQHVAGIAVGNGAGASGAPAAGVAPGAQLIAVQVFHREESSCGFNNPTPCTLVWGSNYIAGLDYVYDLRNAFTIAAVNLSLGTVGTTSETCDDLNPITQASTKQLRDVGIMVVFAAGNSSASNGVSGPSCVSSAVRVGNSTLEDGIAARSNRGPLLTLFAPGSEIISAINDNGFGKKSGTSMAAPHVAGAFAVLRQAYPSESAEELLNRMTSTGVPITYMAGGNSVTTPRLDLLAALGKGNPPPALTVAQATVTVNEGTTATNNGTVDSDAPVLGASRGTVTRNGSTWTWSAPTVDGPRDNGPVTITATSSKGASTAVTFTLTVNNVAPTVILDPQQVTTGNELTTIPISAGFTDPGREDTHSATIVCYDLGNGNRLEQPGTIGNVVIINGLLRGTVTSPGCPYGDNGSYTVEVIVRDRDGGQGSASFEVNIGNVAPTVAITAPATTLINGVPTVLVPANTPTTFQARASDPGSDDLTFTWDWNDGSTPATRTVFNAGTTPDPFLSPSVNPRLNILDAQVKSFGQACLYQVGLTVVDDDQGSVSRTRQVFVAGNSGRARSSGYWQTQYRDVRTSPVGQASLECYLQVARQFSTIFSELRAADTFDEAGAILQNAGGGGDMRRALDQQLLAAWINLADGAYGWNTLVDTNRDRTPDTAFSAVVLAAEAVRGNPNATRAQLEAQKNRLEAVNLMHGG